MNDPHMSDKEMDAVLRAWLLEPHARHHDRSSVGGNVAANWAPDAPTSVVAVLGVPPSGHDSRHPFEARQPAQSHLGQGWPYPHRHREDPVHVTSQGLHRRGPRLRIGGVCSSPSGSSSRASGPSATDAVARRWPRRSSRDRRATGAPTRMPVTERREDGVVVGAGESYTFPWDANDPRNSGTATIITNETDYREGATDAGVDRAGRHRAHAASSASSTTRVHGKASSRTSNSRTSTLRVPLAG